MFSNMSFSTSLFLLLLFFTQGIPSIDGRPLNSGKISNQPQPNDMTTKIIAGNFNRDMQVESSNGESFANAPPGDGVIGASQVMPPPPPVHDTSDFRPPVNDISNQPQPNDTTTKIIAGNFNRDMQVERSNGESFANAPPGDGVIGASQVVPPPPPVHDTSDFRPTAPGHSPGVGHSVHN